MEELQAESLRQVGQTENRGGTCGYFFSIAIGLKQEVLLSTLYRDQNT